MLFFILKSFCYFRLLLHPLNKRYYLNDRKIFRVPFLRVYNNSLELRVFLVLYFFNVFIKFNSVGYIRDTSFFQHCLRMKFPTQSSPGQ